MERFDSVGISVINNLTAFDAVKLLHDLIMAEIRRLSISFNLVSIPYEINSADGGIDGLVDIQSKVEGSHLIFEGKTYYQSKSGKVTFTEKGLKEVLCENAPARNLKPKIREIAELNGHLVLFFSGCSAPNIETARQSATKTINAELPESAVKIHIVQAETIIGMLDDYISLRHRLLEIRDFSGLLFEEWERQPIMCNHFEVDSDRQQKIEDIQALVRNVEDGNRLIRVIGYPGIGKTRSVLEALREPDLSPLVIYFDKPSKVLDTNLIIEMSTRHKNEAIIVVDECDLLSHTQLVNAVAGAKSKIKVITIYNERLGAARDVKFIDFSEGALSQEAIIAIIESYNLPNNIAMRWEPFCDGSPRVAHMLAENINHSADSDLLANPSYDLAMERILANTEDLYSDVFKKRKDVLCWLSLFHKFGWSREFGEERRFILLKIQGKTNYSENDIEQVIQELKERKVLQGDKTLYISPRLLHIRAWVWWWEKYGKAFDFDDMCCADHDGKKFEMSHDLYNWFTEMFQYAREVEGASEVVKSILALDGPLGNEPELLEALNGNFFTNLVTADPDDALLLLEKWFTSKTDSELEQITQVRMNLVFALQRIAVWGELFPRAANLLLRLAYTETDHTYSNNSEGVFAGLFSNAPGRVAPAEASPEIRFPIMDEAVHSENPKKQMMGLKALEAALQAGSWHRFGGFEEQGLRKEPELWTPRTYEEIFQAVRRSWKLLLSVLPDLKNEHLDKAVSIIDNSIRLLVTQMPEAQEYLNDYGNLIKSGAVSAKTAVSTLNGIRRYAAKDLSEEVATRVKTLADYLEGNDVTSRLKRYLANDSFENWYGDEENIERSNLKVEELVHEVAVDYHIIDQNAWLFSREATNVHLLGKGLAALDIDYSLFDQLIRLQEINDNDFGNVASSLFLSSYLLGIHQRDPEKWQIFLDQIVANEKLVHWYAELCLGSHIDNHNANIILDLVKSNKVERKDLCLFVYDAYAKELSEGVFIKWIEYLVSVEELAATADAIRLFSSYYVFKESKPLPQALTLKLITSPSLLVKDQRVVSGISYEYSIIVERYIEQYPNELETILDLLLENFGEEQTVFEAYGGYTEKVLDQIVATSPSKAWTKIANRLAGDEIDFRLEIGWMMGSLSTFEERHGGALSLFPKDMVLDWIDEAPNTRASRIAYLVPHDYTHELGAESWYAIILQKYGELESVQNSLWANFGTGGFSGPPSIHYAKQVEDIKRFAELHKDSKQIQSWTTMAIALLNKQVGDARNREERRGY